MLQTLNWHELHYPAVEKVATVLINAVMKLSHFLSGQHFTIGTDLKSVAFMMNNHKRTKIKKIK